MKIFLPSMIEVEFTDYYKVCSKLLYSSGFNSFHIDFADGVFINRRIKAWEKVKFLKSLGKKIELTAHVMCQAGCHKGSLEEVTIKCLENDFKTIYFHYNAFKNFSELVSFKEKYFVEKNKKFGLVSEVFPQVSEQFIKIINKLKVKKILQMGVPIGKGGQNFDPNSIEILDQLSISCPDVEFYELDGGLTLKIIKKNISSQISFFSGWSIISHNSPEIVLQNALAIKELITK